MREAGNNANVVENRLGNLLSPCLHIYLFPCPSLSSRGLEACIGAKSPLTFEGSRHPLNAIWDGDL